MLKGAALNGLGKYHEASGYFDKALAIKSGDFEAFNNKLRLLKA
jgi:hypothetical protein